jgi:glycosyltransferase involved in cell wall biosynthesis
LNEFAPDMVVFKGMGYLLPYWLLKKRYIAWTFSFITGGNPDDILIPASSFIYSEYASQLTGIYSRFARQGRALVLGKYIPDEDFPVNGNREFDIVSVGALSPRKNHRALIPLFKTRSILLVGDGPERQTLESASRDCARVVLTGAVPKEEVSTHIRRARLMVHPSKSEGFPRVFSEAFAAGVPVVALKRAIRGEFPENKAGLLVEESELETSVNQLLDDASRLEAFSRQARELADTMYRGDVVYSQILKGLEAAREEPTLKIRFLYRFFLLPLRYCIWLIDYYYYFIGRTVKRAIKARLKKG